MIKNIEILESIRESWVSVRTLEGMIQTNTKSGTIFTLIPTATNFTTVPESLLLLFAVSVLEDTLCQLQDEKVFASKGKKLKNLMDASQNYLSWLDFDAVYAIRERRNDIAHRRKFLSTGQCQSDIATIGQQLLSWGVLNEDVKIDYGVEFKPLN